MEDEEDGVPSRKRRTHNTPPLETTVSMHTQQDWWQAGNSTQ